MPAPRVIGSIAATLVALLLLPTTAALGQDRLRAGAASADITPPVGTPMFAYTARSAIAGGHVDRPMQIVADPDQNLYAKSFVPSKGIHQRVKARAIVLERGGAKYALVQADLGGVPYALTRAVADRVASTGIAADRILLSATHTHSSTGPIWPADNGGYAALGGDLFDPRIFELTVDGISQAILRADHGLRPAELGVGTIELRGASRNRAPEPFANNEDLPADEAARQAASIDPELSVVRVDERSGRPMAVWSNFAIHATSFGDGNLLFSGDNPGYTEEIVERTLSARAKGGEVVNVWTNGNEGDISPDGGPDRIGGEPAQHVTSSFASAHMAGRRVADGVLRAWEDAGEDMTATPSLGARTSYLAFDGTQADGEPVGPVAVLGGAIMQEGLCAPVDDMAGPGQGRKFPGLAGVGLVPNVVPISMWQVGSLGVAGFPSEITKQMGERIRRRLEQQSAGAYDRVALAGLSNAYISYTATPEEYDTCHYEGAFTLFGRRQGARLRDAALAVNEALLNGRDAPAGIEPPALGFGTTAAAPPRRTPGAGTALEQPTATDRLGRARFSWQGGDPSIDAPRGADFVRLQRRSGKGWDTVLTEASFRDATERSPGDIWTETVQFDECDPLGTYRLLVTGRADRGAGPTAYSVTSTPFALRPAQLQASDPVVEGGAVRVRALYPDPGPEALMALPRLVRTGVAELRVTAAGETTTVLAHPDDATGTFTAAVPAGATAELVAVRDGCGNRTA